LETSGQLNGFLVLPLRKIHMGFKVRLEKRTRVSVNTLSIPRVDTSLLGVKREKKPTISNN